MTDDDYSDDVQNRFEATWQKASKEKPVRRAIVEPKGALKLPKEFLEEDQKEIDAYQAEKAEKAKANEVIRKSIESCEKERSAYEGDKAGERLAKVAMIAYVILIAAIVFGIISSDQFQSIWAYGLLGLVIGAFVMFRR